MKRTKFAPGHYGHRTAEVGRALGPCGGTKPPPPIGDGTIYDLPTDKNVPPVPVVSVAPGPAATWSYTDPITGAIITRVTDENTLNQATIGGDGFVGYAVDGASFKNDWSKDATYFLCRGGSIVFKQTSPGKWTYYKTTPSRANSWCSFTTDTLTYQFDNFGFAQWDIEYDGSSTNHIFTIPGGVNGQNAYPMTSYDDRYFASYHWGPSQDLFRRAIWWDSQTGQYKRIDLDAGTMGAPGDTKPIADQDGPFTIPLYSYPTDCGFHSAELDRTGQYLWLGVNATNVNWPGKGWTVSAAFVWIWDVWNNNLFRYASGQQPVGMQSSGGTSPKNDGHSACGFGDAINDGGGVTPTSSWNALGYWYRSLSFPALQALTYPKDLIVPSRSGSNQNVDTHLSWSNNRPDEKQPVLVSRYVGGNGPYATPAEANAAVTLYDQMVIAIDVDTTTIYKVCYHHCWYTTGGFWTAPHGNVSRDGTRFIFTSNWDGTLSGRQDIFMVTLPVLSRRKYRG